MEILKKLENLKTMVSKLEKINGKISSKIEKKIEIKWKNKWRNWKF